MIYYFDPLNRLCKSITGACGVGKEVEFNVFCLKGEYQEPVLAKNCLAPNQNAYFLLCKDGEPKTSYLMKPTEYGWTISIKINQTGLYYYNFSFENGGFINRNYRQTGEYSSYDGNAFLLTVFSNSYKTPEWFKGGIMYQIFPDRFCRVGTMPDINDRVFREDWGGMPSFRPNEHGKVLNNDFFGGNFKGVQSKLAYLKELGVSVIYFNPVFEAASNHRYDTSNYKKIDPVLGTQEEFEELLKAAENQEIRVILDGVFNHTGDNSVYFNKYGKYDSIGAYQSKDSPYYTWYSFQEHPDRYSSWWGIDVLPETNESSPSFQEFIFGDEGVLKYWLNTGIGGYRLDVADELPDFFLKKLRKAVKNKDKNAIIIGEVWEDASDKIAYSKRREYLQGHELDSVMNYPLKNAIIHYVLTGNTLELSRTVRLLIDHYPKQTLDCLMNILGTHDTPRILTVLGGKICNNKEEMASEQALLSEKEKENAIKKLKMAVLLQYTLPGVPCVYYGDENGMEGHIDPFCRKCFDWERLNSDLIAYYQKLGSIRLKFKNILKKGIFKEIISDNGLFLYKREQRNKSVYVFVNNSNEEKILKFKGRYQEYLSDIIFNDQLVIKPMTYGIFSKH